MLTISDGGGRSVAPRPVTSHGDRPAADGRGGNSPARTTSDLVQVAARGRPVEAGRALNTLDRSNGSRGETDRQVTAFTAPVPAAVIPLGPQLPQLAMGLFTSVVNGGLAVTSRVAPAAGEAARDAGAAGQTILTRAGALGGGAGERLVAGAGELVGGVSRAVTPAADATDPRLGQAVRTVETGATDLTAAAPAIRGGLEQVGRVAGNIADGTGRFAQAVLNTAGQVAQQAHTTYRNDPAGLVEWLSGPEGPSTADWTGAVPGLQAGIGHAIDAAMGHPVIADAVGRAFGFEYVAAGDFYTTNEHSIQSMFGFHDFYDKVGKLGGMDLDDRVFTFRDEHGTEHRVELWKGSYGNGGAFGGEIGIYTRGTGERGVLGNILEHIPGYYSSANGSSQIATTQEIYDKTTGETYFRNDGAGADDGEHFWNLAIRTDPGVNHEDLGQRGTLVMNSPGAAQALAAEMNRQGVPASVGADGVTVSYDWK